MVNLEIKPILTHVTGVAKLAVFLGPAFRGIAECPGRAVNRTGSTGLAKLPNRTLESRKVKYPQIITVITRWAILKWVGKSELVFIIYLYSHVYKSGIIFRFEYISKSSSTDKKTHQRKLNTIQHALVPFHRLGLFSGYIFFKSSAEI